MKMRFILPLALTMVLFMSLFVAADYEPVGYLRDINCDPVEVGIRALEDCNIAGNVDAPEGKYVNADLPLFYEQNKVLASRDCYQRSNVRVCNWDADGTGDIKNVRIAGQWISYKDNAKLSQCLAIVNDYCGEFDKVKQIPMKTETGTTVDRDYKTTVEGGGLPTGAEDTEETEPAVNPTEDTTTPTDTTTTPTATDESMEKQNSSSLIWWILLVVVVLLLIWWAVGRNKGGAKASTKATSEKAESKHTPAQKKKSVPAGKKK